MKIGSIRVSKQEQNEALQRDALKEAGCEKHFNDKMTGSTLEISRSTLYHYVKEATPPASDS